MLKFIEPILHILYLITILIMGGYLVRNSVGNKLYKSFGFFALTLALGDGIYLLPRMYAILTTGIEENMNIIGWGRMGNSIMITILFLMIYDIYSFRYSKNKNIKLEKTLIGLAMIRVILCLLPWNKWFELEPSPLFALLRFIPLGIIGLFLIILIYYHSNKYEDKNFKLIMLATFIALLFAEPRMYFIEGSAVVIQSILRSMSFITIIIVGYKELRDINVLSRF
ncbi:hypothetical protein E9840_10410 [Tissierella creatinini]|nr:hypothetical protein E9840_10410 [Tissierella creatinini]TJX64554.1 hypothetical protein E8P77_11935 [Soehngenia saccharolytica]